MSRITSRHTTPEIAFRKYLWLKGLRGYRLHKKLPGKPDLYFGRKKVAVFIDGCFWHMCPQCFVRPRSNNGYWDSKIKRNVERDREVDGLLVKRHVKVIRFWEHEIKNDIDVCFSRLLATLD